MNTENKVQMKAALIPAIVVVVAAIIGAPHVWNMIFKPEGFIEGTVRDEDTGEHISGAEVKVGNKTTKTDTLGKYKLSLRPGDYIVSVSVDKYSRKEEKGVKIESDKAKNKNFELELKKGFIEVFVTDDTDSGNVISGAIVKAENTSTETNMAGATDELGKYKFSLKPGKYTVSASADMYARKEEMGIVVVPAETTNKSFELKLKKGSIAGAVKHGGNAIYGAIVRVEDASTRMTDVTDESGTFHFNELSLIPGKYTVLVSAYKYGAKTQQVSVEPDKPTTMEVEMEPSSPDKWVTAPPFSGFRAEAHWEGTRPDYRFDTRTWTPPHGWVIVEPLEINAKSNNGGYDQEIISGELNIPTEQTIRDIYGSAINVVTGNGQSKITEQLETEMNTRIEEIELCSAKGNTIQVSVWGRAWGNVRHKKRGWYELSSVRALLRYIGRPDRGSLVSELEKRYNIDIP
ncbi:collagen binding domain-containing protein [Candidatus Poribacteria bacterium]